MIKVGTHSFNPPLEYGDLTVKQFLSIRKSDPKDIIGMLEILTGVPRDVWEQTKDLDVDLKVLPCFEWLKAPFDPSAYVLPDKLKIDGKYYDRPKSLGTERFGQKIALQKEAQKVQEAGGNDIDLIGYALALYFQPAYYNTDKYSADQVEELLPKVMECKISEAFPIASFFLINYGKLLQKKDRNFLMLLARKKYERELEDSKSSENFQQYTLYRRVLIKITRKFSKWITTRSFSRSGTRKRRQNISVS